MSTSDLYRVYRTKATHYAEYRNGWGSAPPLWNYLCNTFLGSTNGWLCFDKEQSQRLWDLAIDERMPRLLRIAHAFCFDRGYCPTLQRRVKELAEACDEVARVTSKPEHVNHWAKIAADLRDARAKPKQVGWGISCTSVEDPWRDWKGRCEPWDIFGLVDTAPQSGGEGAKHG